MDRRLGTNALLAFLRTLQTGILRTCQTSPPMHPPPPPQYNTKNYQLQLLLTLYWDGRAKVTRF